MKTGLVLEGGAMRALFSAGVLDVMMENGLEVDGVIGVSAGACFGCNVKSHQPGRVIRYNTRFAKDPRLCSFRSLIRTGDLYGADFCYRELPVELDVFDVKTYAADPTVFYVVCTDVETGKAVYQRLDRGDEADLQWIRASASMPLASRVVEAGGRKLLDGGIADSIPLRAFEELGYERNIVILTQPEDYEKKPSKILPVLRRALRRFPRTVEALAVRHQNYNEATAYVKKRENEGTALVIRPAEKLPIGHVEHDAQKMRAVYELGRTAGLERLADMKDFLKENRGGCDR